MGWEEERRIGWLRERWKRRRRGKDWEERRSREMGKEEKEEYSIR